MSLPIWTLPRGAVSLLHALLLVCIALPHLTAQQTRNSTRKIRVVPGEVARRVGTAVHWETDFEQAMAKSRETGKPIFWYVPSIPGTFMDRKIEIDRYMMAGPFSWPRNIAMLNADFIPLKLTPGSELAAEFELVRYRFVEPGFLILDASRNVARKIDRLTTLHPMWFERQLGRDPATEASPSDDARQRLDAAWVAFGAGEAPQLDTLTEDAALAAEVNLLQGMFAFRNRQTDEAIKYWRAASQAQPDHPMAWKAAAEAEGWGPFVRGFEIFRDLPEAAWLAGTESPGSAAPPNLYTSENLWKLGTEFLLGMQRSDGGFVDCDYDFGGSDSLPNVLWRSRR